jgi:hypothetical protein
MAVNPKSLANLTGGSRKGKTNRNTALLKDMILEAVDRAGGADYLLTQASENPAAFMTLIGKVLPMQVTGADGDAVQVVTTVRLVGG